MIRVPPVTFARVNLEELELTDVDDYSWRFLLHEAALKLERRKEKDESRIVDDRLRNGLAKTK
jgi:hypothetical protein